MKKSLNEKRDLTQEKSKRVSRNHSPFEELGNTPVNRKSLPRVVVRNGLYETVSEGTAVCPCPDTEEEDLDPSGNTEKVDHCVTTFTCETLRVPSSIFRYIIKQNKTNSSLK